jgi:hypothetical protein
LAALVITYENVYYVKLSLEGTEGSSSDLITPGAEATALSRCGLPPDRASAMSTTNSFVCGTRVLWYG